MTPEHLIAFMVEEPSSLNTADIEKIGRVFGLSTLTQDGVVQMWHMDHETIFLMRHQAAPLSHAAVENFASSLILWLKAERDAGRDVALVRPAYQTWVAHCAEAGKLVPLPAEYLGVEWVFDRNLLDRFVGWLRRHSL
jgi:hypothetical protein